ncbi:DDE-type integrase/transposase/recombinase [Tenggerimyces flavus]|uniref:Transposase family protein n=1 Tax=Tenggerimyces flavus TaxID=1708749 RepID=A0ABV7Y608_9ACTN|nr:DDE-type integrase/transposase/recombinase [Tenggerimyces flavus]MBM7790330.1 hypothetical protein [Tenggerimyces flavus]
MVQRLAVARQVAVRYRAAGRADKSRILDELCATTGWHRDHARKVLRVALRVALRPKRVRRRRRVGTLKSAMPPPGQVYGPEVVAALERCWAVLGGPCGKRLAPFLPELVDRLRQVGELQIPQQTADLLVAMSAATIDRRLAKARARLPHKGRSGTKFGSLLKAQIPVRMWSQWDDDRPGFVEVDLVGHEGGNSRGEFCQTLTVTDIASGWTETRAVRNKAAVRVRDALDDIAAGLPFPLLGIDSDNGSEFINHHLLGWCTDNKITFTRSREAHKNDNAHVEQKNWSVVRQTVGYLRFDTDAETELLNRLYQPLRLMINFFTPQQKLQSKTRHGAKVIKKHNTAKTPFQRLLASAHIDQTVKNNLTGWYDQLNPAQLRRDIATLQQHLLDMSTAKGHPNRVPALHPPRRPSRAKTHEATTPSSRAS